MTSGRKMEDLCPNYWRSLDNYHDDKLFSHSGLPAFLSISGSDRSEKD